MEGPTTGAELLDASTVGRRSEEQVRGTVFAQEVKKLLR